MKTNTKPLNKKAVAIFKQAFVLSMFGAGSMMMSIHWLVAGRQALLDNEQASKQLIEMMPLLDIGAACLVAVAVLCTIHAIFLHREVALIRKSSGDDVEAQM